MNTRILMASSAAFLAVLGLAQTFAPQEILGAMGLPSDDPAPVLVQLSGASFVGWALVNWTARGLLIGGIYSRPLTLGNLVHFASGSFAIGKAAVEAGFSPLLLVPLAGYVILACCFGYLVFGRGAACVPESGQG